MSKFHEYHVTTVSQSDVLKFKHQTSESRSCITQNIGVQKISQKPVKVTKSWLIDLVSWTNLGSQFGGDESDELA